MSAQRERFLCEDDHQRLADELEMALPGYVVDAIEQAILTKLAEKAQPLFWYRPRSDGLYEGPIHNAQIESVRKESGAWVPLHAHPPTPTALLEACNYIDALGGDSKKYRAAIEAHKKGQV